MKDNLLLRISDSEHPDIYIQNIKLPKVSTPITKGNYFRASKKTIPNMVIS